MSEMKQPKSVKMDECYRKGDIVLVNGSVSHTSTMYRVLARKCTWDYQYNIAGRRYYVVESLDGQQQRKFYAEAINGKVAWK